MSLTVAVSLDGVRLPMSRDSVARIARAALTAEHVRNALVSVTFLSNVAMRALNGRHLGRDRETDVIAFAFRSIGRTGPIIGDVYIAPEVGRDSALERGITVREELTRLIVHGTLHVLGHEHPETGDRTKSPMWRKQERLVRRLAGARK
jgi:probable rRNA maturation factor